MLQAKAPQHGGQGIADELSDLLWILSNQIAANLSSPAQV
jgi:hypothetical protein